MLDFISLILFLVLICILFKKFFVPVIKEEVKRAETITKNAELKFETLKLEKEKLELEINKLKGE